MLAMVLWPAEGSHTPLTFTLQAQALWKCEFPSAKTSPSFLD